MPLYSRPPKDLIVRKPLCPMRGFGVFVNVCAVGDSFGRNRKAFAKANKLL